MTQQEAHESLHVCQPTMLVRYRDKEVEEKGRLRHAKAGDAGYDLAYAPTDGQPLHVMPYTYKIVPSGVYVKIPRGYVGILCGRSSTFGKRGMFVVESRIDSGYTGELFAKVWHPGVAGGDYEQMHGVAVIRPWERLAQLVIVPYLSPSIEVVNELPATERNVTGFGSSGF